jgi:hypothetical protein
MRFYVIRHKVTQRLLPQSYSTGSTWWNPVEHDPKKDELPRLFYSKKAAKSCIITWAKGHAVKKTAGTFDSFDDFEEWLEYEAVPGRTREQLEVVPVHLSFGEPL